MKDLTLGLIARIQNALARERGDIQIGGALGIVAVVIIVLIFFWLAESAGKTNFFD